jgi:oxygen-independent coproporphyrinogen-3 oxidase
MLGLYLHIPFCSAICNYCNFNRGLFEAELKTRYVAGLIAEIGRAGTGAAADTIFFGGGTPSLLEPDEIARIIAACASSFDLAADREVTLEANPESVTAERLAAYRAAGVTRVSFGVRRSARCRRLHSVERARSGGGGTAALRQRQHQLMMWLPKQGVGSWSRLIRRSRSRPNIFRSTKP